MSWKVPQRSAHGVVHQDRRRAHVAPQGGKRGVDLSFVRDVAGVGLGVLDIPLQRRQALAIAGEHGDRVTAGGEPAHDRAARTWADACDDGNGTIHVRILSNSLFPISSIQKRHLSNCKNSCVPELFGNGLD